MAARRGGGDPPVPRRAPPERHPLDGPGLAAGHDAAVVRRRYGRAHGWAALRTARDGQRIG